MADLGQAYVQIVPKATGITSKISNLLAPGSQKAGQASGTTIASGIKKALVAAGIGAAIAGVVKSAVSEGGKLEQSYGGLETIYGKAADQAKRFAKNASDAGVSANDYAEQAVSFGAALKQAYGGDTTKAVKAANTAILDMTDNAAKMGTPIQSIQDAYQGFAKQNYTMLDNLKLGYGGTKTEMERLLADAEKLTGKKYDISNLGDVYEAIHAIQGELGLTGVAADEAATTFEGSFNAMKANWKNLLGEMALGGEEVGPMMAELADSAATFLFDNLLPMVGNVFKSLPEAIGTFISVGGPKLAKSAKALIDGLISGIQTYGPTILAKGGEIISNLVQGIVSHGPQVLSTIKGLLSQLINYIASNLPTWAAKGGELIGQLAQGLLQAIPGLISFLISSFNTLFPAVISALGNLLINAGKGIINGLKSILSAAGKAIANAIKVPLNALKGVLSGIWASIKGTATAAWNGVKAMATTVWNAIKTAVMNPIRSLKTILSGLWNGIKGTASSAWNGIKSAITKPITSAKEKVQSIFKKIKSFFPIKLGHILNFKTPSLELKTASKSFFGKTITYPTGFHISWNAKGGIVDGATLIGAGEKGAEAIVPLDPFWKRLDAMADQIAKQNDGKEEALLVRILATLEYIAESDKTIRWNKREVGRMVNEVI